MGYGSKSLNDLRDDAERIGREHGFTEASIAEDIALMHSELSEALEDLRAGCGPNDVWYEEKITIDLQGEKYTRVVKHSKPYPRREDGSWDLDHPYKPCGIRSELADTVIRILHFSGKHSVDLEQAVREKMTYNETRPFKHGDKKL